MSSMLLTNARAGSADRQRVDSAVRLLEAGGPVEVAVLGSATELDRCWTNVAIARW